MEVDEVVHFSTGEPIAKVSRANGGLIQRDTRKAQRARDALREIPIDDLIARAGKAGELYMNATLPMGDGTQTPDEFVHAQSASHRAARADVPGQHEEERVRARGDAQHPRVAHARAVARRALDRQGRRARRADQLSGPEPRARSRAAVEFAGRARAVDADHPDADRAGAQAGTAGAVDAVPHGRGVRRGRHPEGRDLDLPGWSGRGCGGARCLRPQRRLRRNADRRSLSRQPSRAGARSRLLEDSDRRRSGRSLGAVSRHDGRERVRQQRPQLHQLLRHLGQPAYAGHRRRHRAAPRRRPAAAARTS